MEGYADTKSTANSYVSSFFKSAYNSIASGYEKMAKDDNEQIWKYRIQAIALCIGGATCMIVGIKRYKGGQ